MASSERTTLTEKASHIPIARNSLNIHIMESFKTVDLMALAYFSMKTDRSTKARLRMEKRTALDFQERH